MSSPSEAVEKKVKKKRINVGISEETYERFWNYIKKKYVSPWRVYSKEVENAIIEYLYRHERELNK
ncbi:MAG: hypothetical protein ACPLYF_02550 [Fervidobacterium sp.]|jgi:hypothetical protein